MGVPYPELTLFTIAFALATSVGVPGRAAGLVFLCASIAVLIVLLGHLAGKPSRRKRQARRRRHPRIP
jgi:hypothetical protein